MKRPPVLTLILALVFSMPATAKQKPATRQDTMDALFADFRGDVPGASVLVIHNGRVALKKSFGLGELESKRKATPKTTYRLASVSKHFTATAILLLLERGKLSLDDSLTKIFPDFPAYAADIRIRHLLNHTSGLLAYEDLIPAGTTQPVIDRDVFEILRKESRTYFPPGTRFRYSNSGYALLACIVEKVSGMPYDKFVAKNIFKPLGMKSSFLTRRDRLTGGNRAFGYSKKGGEYQRTDQSMTSFVLGDGGIYSSLEDLQKWEAALASGKLLKKSVLDAAMSATTAASDAGVSYGYGWYVGKHGSENAVWHEGSSIGFRNFYLRIPGKSLTVIVLTNRNDADPATLARKVADLFLQKQTLNE